MVCGLRSGGNTRSVDYPWTALLANAIRSPAGDGAKGAAPNPFACQETRTEIVARRNREEILENAASGLLSFSRTHAAPVALRHSIWPDIAMGLYIYASLVPGQMDKSGERPNPSCFAWKINGVKRSLFFFSLF